MDTEQLEKQFSIWNRLMYAALGSAITLLLSSPGNFAYTGIVWITILICATVAGFFLLLAKRWRALPLSRARINTTFGYLLAGWLASFVPLTMGGGDDMYNLVLLLYTAILIVLYWRFRTKSSGSDEMFP